MNPADTFRKKPVPVFGIANVWFCDRCGCHGDATFDPDTPIEQAVAQIRDAHKLAAPHCISGTRYIRFVNFERLKEKGIVA